MNPLFAQGKHADPRTAFEVLPPRDHRQVWMVSFADLMAILLTFMVVSFSTKQIEEASWATMSQSMQSVFQGDVKLSRRDATADFRQVVRLVEDSFPALVEAGSVKLTAAGMELDLETIVSSPDELADLVGILLMVDRSLIIQATASLPDANPTSVQRTLAWEKGLANAFDLRARLAAEGLDRDPRISVSVATKKTAGATLLIERREGDHL